MRFPVVGVVSIPVAVGRFFDTTLSNRSSRGEVIRTQVQGLLSEVVSKVFRAYGVVLQGVSRPAAVL